MPSFRSLIAVLGLALACMTPSAGMAQSESGLGRLEFANSGAPEAQGPFIQGLLLLHSFEYEDAAEAFRQAQEIDRDFAMAYWGEALTHNHPIWMVQDRDAALEILSRLGSTPAERLAKAGSERERDWLNTAEVLYGEGEKRERDYAYMAAMESLAARYPDDLDARAFHALSILGTCHEGRDIPRYMQAAAIVEEVYELNPEHPGALHYLVHSYDDPIHAPLGLRAARLYSRVAERAGHALHMPSHIFVALGMWDEVGELNEESWLASNARRERKGLGMEARGYHARIWEHYAFLQQGRYGEAMVLVQQLAGDLGTDADGPRLRGALGQMRAAQVVATGDPGAAEVAADLNVGGATLASHLYASAVAALARGDREGAMAARAGVQDLLGDAGGDWSGNDAPTHIVALELDALLALHSGRADDAVEILAQAASVEDEQPFAFGPPVPVKPAHELLADVHLMAGDPGLAVAHYQKALERTPGRAVALLGLARAAEAVGDSATALRAYARLSAAWDRADADLVELAEVRKAVAAGGS